MKAKCFSSALSLVCMLTASNAAHAERSSQALSWNCNGCHGPAGVSGGPAVPSIAGIHQRYFFKVMRDFKLDERNSTIMGRIARGYRTAEFREMAEHFSANTWVSAQAVVSDEQFLAGKAIHDEHCAECHEDAGRYQDKEIPRLAGQWPSYLLYQLVDYQQDHVKMPQPDKMRERVKKLTREDLEAVCGFYGRIDDAYRLDVESGLVTGEAQAVLLGTSAPTRP